MDIYVLNGLNGIVGIVDSYESVIWVTQYFGQGEFQLVTAGNSAMLNLLQPKRLLVRSEDISANGTYKNVMMIKKVKLSHDMEKGWVLTVTGKGLKSMVGQRVIWNQDNITGNAETGIRRVIADNIINPDDAERKINNFRLESQAQGFTETFDLQCFGQNLADWVETVCNMVGFGWDVYISNGKYNFTLYKGTDRTYNQQVVPPVVFSSQFDNLISSIYTFNLEGYQNAALVGGEGEGTSQRRAIIGTASGLDRYEAYIDGSDVSSNGEIITEETYLAMLRDYGQSMIDKTAYVEKFESSIDPNGLYLINRDYFLGDLVQIENEAGIKAAPRITEIIYSEDSGGVSVVPTFSNWEVE